MSLINKLQNILTHPLINTIANTIKKFQSSKSYWSISYLVLVFTLRESIAWKWGAKIKEFSEIQAQESSYSYVWDILGFMLEDGNWELIILGLSIFIILSLVRISESVQNKISIKENFISITLLLIIIGILVVDMTLKKDYSKEKENLISLEKKLENAYIFNHTDYRTIYNHDEIPIKKLKTLQAEYNLLEVKKVIKWFIEKSPSISDFIINGPSIDMDNNMVGGFYAKYNGKASYIIKDSVLQPAKWGIHLFECEISSVCSGNIGIVVIKSPVLSTEFKNSIDIKEFSIENFGIKNKFKGYCSLFDCIESNSNFEDFLDGKLTGLDAREYPLVITYRHTSNVGKQWFSIFIIYQGLNNFPSVLKYLEYDTQEMNEAVGECKYNYIEKIKEQKKRGLVTS